MSPGKKQSKEFRFLLRKSGEALEQAAQGGGGVVVLGSGHRIGDVQIGY